MTVLQPSRTLRWVGAELSPGFQGLGVEESRSSPELKDQLMKPGSRDVRGGEVRFENS